MNVRIRDAPIAFLSLSIISSSDYRPRKSVIGASLILISLKHKETKSDDDEAFFFSIHTFWMILMFRVRDGRFGRRDARSPFVQPSWT